MRHLYSQAKVLCIYLNNPYQDLKKNNQTKTATNLLWDLSFSCQCLNTTKSTKICAKRLEFLLLCHTLVAYNLLYHYTLNFTLDYAKVTKLIPLSEKVTRLHRCAFYLVNNSVIVFLMKTLLKGKKKNKTKHLKPQDV